MASVTGGEERQDSVWNGLQVVSPEADIVLVHDAARPLVTPAIIGRVIRAARRTGGAVAAVPVKDTIKVAGDDFDEALVRYMRKKHNLLIGERTGEDIKIQIGAAYRRPEVLTMEVRGRNLVTGLPKTIVVSSDETLEALQEPALQIVDAVHNVLERTPPELAADIYDRGIVFTGGGSLLYGLDQLCQEKTGINTMIAEAPLTAVAIGTGKFIEFQHGDPDDRKRDF